MKTAFLMFVMFTMTACAVDLSPQTEGINSTEQASVLKPPAPQPEFSFCDGFVTCNPYRDSDPDFNCTLDCFEPAFCPDYTPTERLMCERFPDWTNTGGPCCGALPCFDKRCARGDRP